MKKITGAALLALALASGAFGQKLVLATWGGARDKTVMEALIAAAQPAFPGVTVEIMLLADYEKTVTTRLVGGQALDIIAVAEGVHTWSDRKQLVAMDSYITKAKLNLDERFGASKSLYARDGKTWALPLRGGPMMVYVNKDLVRQKPRIEWSYADLVAAAKAAYRPGATKADTAWGFVPAGSGTWWPWYTSFIYAAGGALLDAKGKPAFDNPKTVQGLRNYAAFMSQHKVSPTLADMADLGQQSPDPVFNSGKAGMIMTGWWNVGSLKDATFNWDIAPIPNDQGRGTVIFGQGLAISATSKNKDAAWKVIAALTDTAAQEKIVDNVWDIPANARVLASEKFLKAKWAKNPLDMSAIAEAVTKGAIALPYSAAWGKMHDIIGTAVNELLKGALTPEATAARIQQDLLEQVFTK